MSSGGSDPVSALIGSWRADAERLRAYGAEQAAAACERHAEQLEAALADKELEALSLAEAAEESGYSYSRIQELVADGGLENIGRRGSPLVRRGDLPRKPGLQTPSGNGSDLADRRLRNTG